MKSYRKIKQTINTILIISLLAFTSCNRNNGPVVINDLPDEIKLGDDFVYEITSAFYLWIDYMPAGIDKYGYEGPAELFEAMYYPYLDHWSFVTDDYQTLQNSLDGEKKAAGYKFQLFRYNTTSNEIFVLVEYVHTDGEAYKAGLKRGDVIISVNNEILTETNYQTLLYQDIMEFGIGGLIGNEVVDLDKTITVSRIEQSFNPILQHQIIETGGKKIGYFLYDQFISDYDDTLVKVIKAFDDQGIDELVLDLRYNPGGYVSSCALFSSMLVPEANLNDVFITHQYNSILTEYYQLQPNADSNFVTYFPEPEVNLNINRLFVLSSGRTASASEALINGLKPYMNVTIIGEQTSGKYTGASLFHDLETPPAHNWGLYLILSKIANADGVTDFVNGFTPNYIVQDDYITPLGDQSEPLLAKAIELITGVTKKSTAKLPESFISAGRSYDNWLEKEGVMIQDGVDLQRINH